MMCVRRLPMMQVMELARLRFVLGRSYSVIAASLGVARSTAQEAVKRFRLSGLTWPLPAELDEDALYSRLYRPSVVCEATEPDFAALSKELARKGVTRKLLWREYAEQQSGQALAYAQFCARFAAFERRLEPGTRMQEQPGGQ